MTEVIRVSFYSEIAVVRANTSLQGLSLSFGIGGNGLFQIEPLTTAAPYRMIGGLTRKRDSAVFLPTLIFRPLTTDAS